MSYPINYPTPQGANVQIFSQFTRDTTSSNSGEWVKPQGASFVWFTLIGGGGAQDDSFTNNVGGGSGAVTNCMVPAFLVPDVLIVRVGRGGLAGLAGSTSSIRYQQKAGTGYTLLEASAGTAGTSGGTGGPASTSNYFSAMGLFQSVAGQNGVNADQSPSATTFLSGGSSTGTVNANYGYSSITTGFFQTQPIIVGVGCGSAGDYAGIGCGGGTATSSFTRGLGGNGLVVIITW